METFAKLFNYQEGQLLVFNNHNADTEQDEIVFRHHNNGLQLEQKLAFPRGESSDEVFARVNENTARKTFDHLQALSAMGATSLEEPKYSTFSLAVQAENLRNAQKQYFARIKKAKQTKSPTDFEEASKVLEISKQIEASFDDTIAQILKPVEGLIHG